MKEKIYLQPTVKVLTLALDRHLMQTSLAGNNTESYGTTQGLWDVDE